MIAPAKLNLCLEVVKRYDSGFHEINSIMVKSSKLYDDIVIEFDENSNDIVIECDNPDVPTDEQNICWKIADKYFEKIGQSVGVKIVITKRIPMLAGLGGGSSDGASVLLALDEYFGDVQDSGLDLRVPEGPTLGLLNKDELIEIASSVGKDIPFFLQDASSAYVSGAGERVESIFDFPQLSILVVNPKVEISTPWAYGQLDEREWFMNNNNRKKLAQAMRKNHHILDDVAQYVYNDFEFIAQEKCPVVGEIKNAMKTYGARATTISGKGPTVFGIFESTDDLEKTKKILQKQYSSFFVGLF